ncbi:aminopeptidase PepB [Paraphotobacterium marinum]|uniref:Aminopeptidase PepB n=1 Tax=Paraphotobacterium marinum TaxID=1755811 RepID=A0A220VET9_9GAMM|nr:aminopeptidase PepB [Paraphotobacterium marinum]ASK78443.1 aminopeptidase PepB [Paraphotobacterium marinum]
MSVDRIFIRLTENNTCPKWGETTHLSFSDDAIIIHVSDSDTKNIIQKSARKIDNLGIKNVYLEGGEWQLEEIWAFFQGYNNPKNNNQMEWNQLEQQEQNELLNRISVSKWSMGLINQSPSELFPARLANEAAEFIKNIAPNDVSYKVIKGIDLVDEGWNGVYSVGKASDNSPCMLILDYNPSGNDDEEVFACLVGKGITFDSGGYSIKPSAGMLTMKADMGGAALVSGALALGILRGLKKRVKLILCCAENMVSGNALKLGDIIEYKNGVSVEVLNTDAEGRLVLADGLIYANSQNPKYIIDCATLTGSAKVALGNDYHAIFSYDHELSQKLLFSASEEKEGFWPLPLADFHRNRISSSFANIANVPSTNPGPGHSVAAAFLSYFVDDYKKNWLHVDCSATYKASASDKFSIGATGIGIRTIANFLQKLN